MFIVKLQPLLHRGRYQMAMYFERNNPLSVIVKKIATAKWSQTHKCWYVPLTEVSYILTCDALKPHCQLQIIAMVEWFKNSKIKEIALLPGSNVQNSETAAINNNASSSNTAILSISPGADADVQRIHPLNAQVLPALLQHLQLKAYSNSTIKTYSNEVSAFLQTIKAAPANKFTAQRIKDYLAYCHTTLGLSENTLHSRMNALKFYYEKVLGYEKFFWEIPRPKKRLILPKVLGEDELRRLFNALVYKKHKAILFTAYSAGLRVSEVINLQIKHIDRSRMQLFIEKSKGKKDRYAGLSPVLLDILENYYKEATPKPLKYLFEGQQPGTKYHICTAQKVFQMAKEKAGIKKEVGFHSLRHSFATHLLEKGIDIKYIKDLLGHFNIHTTERYLHVKREKLINIVSPLDDLWEKEDIHW